MTHRFSALLALALAAGFAVSARAEGVYVGGGLSAPDYTNTINGAGGNGGGHGPGLKVYGGYQLTPHFAVEGGYFNLGRSQDIGGTVKGQGLFVDGVGSLELVPRWSLLASAGIAEARFSTPGGNDSSPAVKLGVGLQHDITSTTAIRLGYDRYHFTNAFDGKPDVGQTVLGVKVSF